MKPQHERDKLRNLCGAVYQAAGAYDLPERFLDALSDAANGEIEKRQKTDNLLPCSAPGSKWQSIDTAPKTRHVQLYKDGRQYVGAWAQNPYTSAVAWSLGEIGDGNRALLENPTHWRELFAPPNG